MEIILHKAFSEVESSFLKSLALILPVDSYDLAARAKTCQDMFFLQSFTEHKQLEYVRNQAVTKCFEILSHLKLIIQVF